MNHRNNLFRIKAVNNALNLLKNEVVFVGGATVSLYADRQTEEVRPTEDVDILVEIWTRKDFADIEQKLRDLGFVNDQFSGVICRYTIQGITVDVMATGEKALGFSNKWYPDGYKNALEYIIDDDHRVKIFSAPYFIASKLEAFKNRGKNDGRTSTDFEDIVFVFENRFSIWEELNTAEDHLKNYLKDTFRQMLQIPFFEEWIDVHASYGSPPATYYIIEKLEEFTR